MTQNAVRQAYSAVEHLLRTGEAAAVLDMSARSLEGMRLTGRGPQFIRISPRCFRYRPRDIERWRRPTSSLHICHNCAQRDSDTGRAVMRHRNCDLPSVGFRDEIADEAHLTAARPASNPPGGTGDWNQVGDVIAELVKDMEKKPRKDAA